MSADNYFVVLPHPGGGFTPVMGFASDEHPPVATTASPSFPTPEEALTSVLHEYAEYGHSISPDCFPSAPGDDEEPVADVEDDLYGIETFTDASADLLAADDPAHLLGP